MRLDEITDVDQSTDEQYQNDSDGTYAGVAFSNDTVNSLKQYQIDNQIPNRVSREKMHTTLLYSRKYLPEYYPYGYYDQPMVGEPQSIEIWPTRDHKNCLVLRFCCQQLCDRHQHLMDYHQATYDFPSFIPHITLSYDVGDLDVEQLPSYQGPIEIVREYGENLNDVLDRNQQ